MNGVTECPTCGAPFVEIQPKLETRWAEGLAPVVSIDGPGEIEVRCRDGHRFAVTSIERRLNKATSFELSLG